MISKLPRWVELGSLLLAAIAGYVNCVGLLGFEHQSVSHLSGTATILGVSILQSPIEHSIHLVGILFSFLVGACVAGFMLNGTTLELGKHYDTILILESILLLIAYLLLENASFTGHFFASAACGLQNAMATKYSGAIVRTTHVTGIFTDLGIMLGEYLRGSRLDYRKGKLFLLIILGFVGGATLGAYTFTVYQFASLLLPSGACLALAMTYFIYYRRGG